MRWRLLFFVLNLVILFPPGVQAQQDYFFEATVSNAVPFVGEQVVYSLRLYTRQISRTNRGTIVDPSFDGFWQQDFGPDREFTALIGEQNYQVKERRYILFPSRGGLITIDPAIFVIPDDPFQAGEALYTEAVTVQAQSVPPVPADVTGFEGAVGQFEMQPTIDRQTAAQGEPVTLQLTVRGTGNLEQLSAPEMPETDSWRVFFRDSTYQAGEADGLLVGEKTFEWFLTPLMAGSQTSPVITLTYFDPLTQSYRSLTTAPLTINVTPVETTQSTLADPVQAISLKPISPSLGTSGTQQSIIFWLLWLVPPVISAYLWLRVRHSQDRAQYAAAHRHSQALTHARKVVLSASRVADVEAYAIFRKGLIGYFADKLNCSPDTVTLPAIEEALARHQIDAHVQTQVLECFELVDQGLYAPFTTNERTNLSQMMVKALSAIDAQWRTS